MPDSIDHDRRRLPGATLLTVASAELAAMGAAQAKTRRIDATTSFAPLKQIEAGVLGIGYAEAGPVCGPVVILLHGWPYDIHSFVEVAPLLAQVGYRVYVPYLRGHGTTRFLRRARCAMGSRPRSRSTSSRSWMH